MRKVDLAISKQTYQKYFLTFCRTVLNSTVTYQIKRYMLNLSLQLNRQQLQLTHTTKSKLVRVRIKTKCVVVAELLLMLQPLLWVESYIMTLLTIDPSPKPPPSLHRVQPECLSVLLLLALKCSFGANVPPVQLDEIK